jgi:polyisoprenoid-binding protein YceI
MLQGTILLVFYLAVMATPTSAQPKPIDTAQSAITIHVGKSGLFSAFGHEHVVRAPISQGVVDENATKPRVEFSVASRQLKVMDADVKPEEREEIQRDMLGPKVLDSEKYQEIRFRSTSIQRVADAKWKVAGELTLHGQTHPMEATASGSNGRYKGAATFKQSEFGIKPVAVAGGSVKVKDELRIEFEITAH